MKKYLTSASPESTFMIDRKTEKVKKTKSLTIWLSHKIILKRKAASTNSANLLHKKWRFAWIITPPVFGNYDLVLQVLRTTISTLQRIRAKLGTSASIPNFAMLISFLSLQNQWTKKLAFENDENCLPNMLQQENYQKPSLVTFDKLFGITPRLFVSNIFVHLLQERYTYIFIRVTFSIKFWIQLYNLNYEIHKLVF